jgi:hypothetical protein
MYGNDAVWNGVLEPKQEVDFVVDEPKDGSFTILCDRDVAHYDVIDLLYMIGGIWRITIEDEDEDEEVPSVLLDVTVDRRFKADEVRAAAIKLLENVYGMELD